MAKLNDVREDSWSVICSQIRKREHPSKHHLAAALRRGEAVPPEAQAYLADLLEGRLDRRGRPRNKRRSGLGPHSFGAALCRWTILLQLLLKDEPCQHKPVQSAFKSASRNEIQPRS